MKSGAGFEHRAKKISARKNQEPNYRAALPTGVRISSSSDGLIYYSLYIIEGQENKSLRASHATAAVDTHDAEAKEKFT